MLLRDGETCARVAQAGRAALLVDMAVLFRGGQGGHEQGAHARSTCSTGRSSRTPSSIPDPAARARRTIGSAISSRVWRPPSRSSTFGSSAGIRPCPSPRPSTSSRSPTARRSAARRVSFVLDGKLPLGACHHQKMIIVDDADRLLRRRRHRPRPLGHPRPPRRRPAPREDPARPQGLRQPARGDGHGRRRRGGDAGGAVPRPLAAGDRRELSPSRRRPKPGLARLRHAGLRGHPVGALADRGRLARPPEVREVEALHLASIRAGQALHLHGEPVFHLAADRRGAGARGCASRTARRWCWSPPSTRRAISTRRPWTRPASTSSSTCRRPTSTAASACLQPGHHAGPDHHRPRQADHHRRPAAADRLGQHQQPLHGLRHRMRSGLEARTAAFSEDRIGELRTGLVAHWFGCAQDACATRSDEANGGGWRLGIETLRRGGYVRLRPITPESSIRSPASSPSTTSAIRWPPPTPGSPGAAAPRCGSACRTPVWKPRTSVSFQSGEEAGPTNQARVPEFRGRRPGTAEENRGTHEADGAHEADGFRPGLVAGGPRPALDQRRTGRRALRLFSAERRLLVERDGTLTTYDTGEHQISGVSQGSRPRGIVVLHQSRR